MTLKLELDKFYDLEVPAANLAFGDVKGEEMIEMYKDGRAAAPPMQLQITKWFPELTYVNAIGYDHVDTAGVRYEAKGFTKWGCDFKPSKMIGSGRVFNEDEAREQARKLLYIFYDITDFPRTPLICRAGKELVEAYPKMKSGKGVKAKAKLFNG